MAWKFEKTFNIGHVLIFLSGVSAGWGMYYSTLSKIDAVAATSSQADAVHDANLARLSANQVEITRTLDRIRDEQASMKADIRGLDR